MEMTWREQGREGKTQSREEAKVRKVYVSAIIAIKLASLVCGFLAAEGGESEHLLKLLTAAQYPFLSPLVADPEHYFRYSIFSAKL